MVQVIRDSPNERAIVAAGWVEAKRHRRGHEVVVLTDPAVTGTSAGPGVEVHDEPTPAWWELTLGARRGQPRPRGAS